MAEFDNAGGLKKLTIDPRAMRTGSTFLGMNTTHLRQRLFLWTIVHLGIRDCSPRQLLRWWLLFGGAFPTLIEWPADTGSGRVLHPTSAMAASPVRLRSVALGGLPQSVAQPLGLSGVTFVAQSQEPAATAAQQMNAPVVCSSASGVWHSPAACPSAGYQGKCTLPPASTGMDGVQIQRFYTGADVTYAADYCTNTAHGTWSTAF